MSSPAEQLNDRLADLAPTVFQLLSRRGRDAFFPHAGILGQTAEAKGCQYNATIGIALNDDGSPMRLPSMDEYILLDPTEVYPYASSYGVEPLRQQWKDMMFQKNPSLSGVVSTPVVSTGLTGALTIAGYLFMDPGEEVFVTDKFWGNYKLIFQNGFGAELSTFNTFTRQGFDIEALRTALSGSIHKQVIVLNFPNNPAGYTPTTEETQEIVTILTDAAERASKGLVVIFDDAYFGLVYEDGVEQESLFAHLNQAHEKLLAVKIDGATKEDYVWGHRIGYITFGCKGMTAEVANVLEDKAAGAMRGLVSNACRLTQSLLLKSYQSPTYQAEKAAKYDVMKSRYQAVTQVLENPEYQSLFTPLPFNSGYFMCVELAEGLQANEVRQALLAQHGVGVIAMNNMIRIAYSCLPVDDIPVVFDRLADVCRQLSPSSHVLASPVAQ